jgi:putative phosphoribosyl transferase
MEKKARGIAMIFANRTKAGQELAMHLRKYANRDDVIVLGAPRGGVPVAFEVATELRAPLDVFVLRKLGVPGREELAFGAIASGGVRTLERDIVEGLGITGLDIQRVTRAEEQELERRERAYRGGRPPLDVSGLTVILVDDGIATGSSMRAAIRALRQMKPARIVIAVPIAPVSTCNRLQSEADELVCLAMPQPFYGVGQFYGDFSQVSDEEVKELLDAAAQRRREPPHHNVQVTGRGTRQ